MPRLYWEQHCNNINTAFIKLETCPLQHMNAIDKKDNLVYMWMDSEESTRDEIANYQCHSLGVNKCTKLTNIDGKPSCRKCVPRVGYGFTSRVYEQSCNKTVPRILESTDPVPTTAGGCTYPPAPYNPLDPKCNCTDPAENHEQIVWDSVGTYESC